jgi:hypothetical protein
LRSRSALYLALVLGCSLVVPVAHAQVRQAAVARIKLLNKKAMDEYDGLEFDAAKRILLEAEGVARSASISGGPQLVQTYVNLGIVCGAGLNDRISAIKYFTEALRIDPNVALDAARSTPILEEMFKTAKENAGTKPPPAKAGFRHTPVDDAKEGRAVRMRARVGADLNAAKVLLHYRAGAASEFETVTMSEDRPGVWSGAIPADRVSGKSIHYYIEVQDDSGQRIEGHGTAASPNVIAVRPAEPGPGPGPRPRQKRKLFSIGLLIGTGVGIVYGGQSEHLQVQVTCPDDPCAAVDIKPGGALTPFHLAPELAYHITDLWHVSAMVRIQLVNAASARGKISVLGLARAKRYFGTGSFRHYLAFGGGGGEIRHRIPLGDYDGVDTTDNGVVDTRVAGVGAFGLGYGLQYMFSGYVGLALELSGMMLVPQFAAQVDINTGLVFSF